MKVRAIEPNIETGALLAGAQFVDAFSIAVDDDALDARHAAQRMLGRSPRWIKALMALRNSLVAPFGLKTPVARKAAAVDTIGAFPVISEAPDRLVAGFNDKHLDFRVVVDVATQAGERCVTATTLVLTQSVRPHLSCDYLAVSPADRPFHAAASCRLTRRDAAGTS